MHFTPRLLYGHRIFVFQSCAEAEGGNGERYRQPNSASHGVHALVGKGNIMNVRVPSKQ